MNRFLHIETATQICSATISEGEKILAYKESNEANIHSKKLSLFIQDLLKETKLAIPQLDAITVSIGPGSYTGLRIGVSMAKGLAYGGNIPIISIATLDILANRVISNNLLPDKKGDNCKTLLCPMIDARRMEVYCKLLTDDMQEVSTVEAKLIDQQSFMTELAKCQMLFFGDGSQKCRDILDHPNAHFLPGITSSSRYMVSLAIEKFAKKDFVDTAYFEPFYLKDFIATIPRNKILPKSK
ncbi:MAG: tRNA (adenosine(37)-N6)-threonylcarbamoyltransferase complex dimerization subunit type 1 TsaB [Bacteroidales bacterium]|nr:tRNA (adenosine(37)-N6)-threonylcarbamoyltransferase complex dimerization subunit type 1 TsaB [Bacteroidales bacterium]